MARAWSRYRRFTGRRAGIARDDDWYALKLQEEVGELIAEYLRLTGRGRRKGASEVEIRQSLADEAADVLAHVLLLCRQLGIDIDAAIRRKWLVHLDGTEP